MASKSFAFFFAIQVMLFGAIFGGYSDNSCEHSEYRSIDGSCNNLENPDWGKSFTINSRLLPPNYGDNFSTPTLAVNGNALPNSSIVSQILYPDKPIENPIFTLAAMQYGQVVAHDLSLVTGNIEPNNSYGETVPEEQISSVNNFLDLSLVYGNTQAVADSLKDDDTGLLRSEIRNGREWLPANPNVNACAAVGPGAHCYTAGDVRVIQNPQLALYQTLLLREHNRIASILSKLNPLWSGEKIYNETRKINIAQHEFRVKYELLPVYLGKSNPVTRGPYKYDPSINPSVLTEFTSGAYRFFHSMIPGHLKLFTENRCTSGYLRLGPYINRPGIIEQDDNEVQWARGLGTQLSMEPDRFHTIEITNATGLHLKTTDINRNRQRGLASYNDFRVYFGVPKAETFEDFADLIEPYLVAKLNEIYDSTDDVELTVGGSLERLVPGTLAGPTFLNILIEQFHRTIHGDRYWFENEGQFTWAQLRELSKASISKLTCDNSEGVESMQPRGFEKISLSNPLLPCSKFPEINWLLWKERKAYYLPSWIFNWFGLDI